MDSSLSECVKGTRDKFDNFGPKAKEKFPNFLKLITRKADI